MTDVPAPPSGPRPGPADAPPGWAPAPSGVAPHWAPPPPQNPWAPPGPTAPAGPYAASGPSAPAGPPPGYAPAPTPAYGPAPGQPQAPVHGQPQPFGGPVPPPPFGPAGGGWPAAGGHAVPLASIEQVVTKSSRKGRLAAAGIGVLALAGGGLFAVNQLGASADGAASPEAAVESFFDALNDEDVLGVMNSLPEGERDVFVPLAERSLAELKRIGVLSDGAALSGISGLDVEFTGYQLRSQAVGDTVANVTVSGGQVTGGYQLDALPLGRIIVDNIFDGSLPSDAGSSTEDNEDDFQITTVHDGDGWHVSLWYSIAETARDEAGLPSPAFGEGVPAAGADSPEAAVEDLFAAMGDLDLRRMIELTPPDEMAALHDYAPLFLDDAEQAVDDLIAEYGIDLRLQATDLDVSGSGDTRTVAVEGFTLDGTVEGEDVNLEWDGDCLTTEFLGQQDEMCRSDALDTMGAELPESFRTFVERLDAQHGGLRVVEVDGAWYVSPIGTAGDAVLQLLAALDADLLQDMIDDGEELASGLFGSLNVFGTGMGIEDSVLGGSLGGIDLNPDFDDTAGTIGDDDWDEDDWYDDSVDTGYDAFYAACGDLEYEMYAAGDAASWAEAVQQASMCAAPFLASGEIDEYDIATELSYPECYTTWPYDPNLTLAQQQDVFAAIDDCVYAD